MAKRGRPKGQKYCKTTVEEMNSIAEFNRMIKNYKKMLEIEKNHKEELS